MEMLGISNEPNRATYLLDLRPAVAYLYPAAHSRHLKAG